MRTNALKKCLSLSLYSLPLFAFAANFTEPRAAVVAPQATANITVPANLPMKVIIYKGRRELLASLPRVPASPPKAVKLPGDKPTAQEVQAYIQKEAREHGVNPALALWIVQHESQFNPRAKGDGEASRGLWQISKIYHPEVPDAVAFNVASSTEWSLERIRSGKVKEWSTYRFCRTLYEDCPF